MDGLASDAKVRTYDALLARSVTSAASSIHKTAGNYLKDTGQVAN
ncbi:MAG: hypothetical protein RIC87_22190 [Kiloniellales bacterium]